MLKKDVLYFIENTNNSCEFYWYFVKWASLVTFWQVTFSYQQHEYDVM